MKKKIGLVTMLMMTAVFLSGCAGVENKEGTFYDIFVKPMDWLLNSLVISSMEAMVLRLSLLQY